MTKKEITRNYIEFVIDNILTLHVMRGFYRLGRNTMIEFERENNDKKNPKYDVIVDVEFNVYIDQVIGDPNNSKTVSYANYNKRSYQHDWKKQDKIIKKLVNDVKRRGIK